MNEHQASRTLLKSPPELWAECSDAQSLAKHLGESVGEVRITSLEPESTVAWEGDRTSGTVKLESSGWGTRVTLTCSAAVREEVPPEPEPVPPDRQPAPGSGRQPDPELAPPDREPAPGSGRQLDPELAPTSAEPAATAVSGFDRAAAPAARGSLFVRVMRFLAPQRVPAAVPASSVPRQAAIEPQTREQQPPEPVRPAQPSPLAEEPAAAAPAEGELPEASNSSAILAAALDSLGQAHHRPFSRA
jgi:hypothetical protein